MARLGFLLDSDNCIGCHACTVACKSEHDVPLGVNRTWVKYIETGTFPDVTRKFSVMRCNQCDDAPCMAICPTSALFRADNGVVDFQDDNCIGCKSCMNACPYDALYINPETNTAHKCNMCNHRIEVGLEPSCQIVCPTEAITIGDLDDPLSKISQIIAGNDVAVRTPEQNTKPKVFYKGADEAALDPTRSAIANDGMIWADTLRERSGKSHPTVPVSIGAKPTDQHGVDARTAYTTAHQMTWKAKVSGYLVTKAIAAGVMLVAALMVLLGHADVEGAVRIAPPIIAGVFLGLTGVLLVTDLKQPARFHYLITKGNWASWLVKGAYVLMAFSVVCGLWFLGGLLGSVGPDQSAGHPRRARRGRNRRLHRVFVRPVRRTRPVANTDCSCRRFLRRRSPPGERLTRSLDLFIDVPEPDAVRWVLLGGIAATAVLIATEIKSTGTRHVELAVHEMTGGAYRHQFWGGGVLVGLIAPAALTIVALTADITSPGDCRHRRAARPGWHVRLRRQLRPCRAKRSTLMTRNRSRRSREHSDSAGQPCDQPAVFRAEAAIAR